MLSVIFFFAATFIASATARTILRREEPRALAKYVPNENVVFFHDALHDDAIVDGNTWGYWSGTAVAGDTKGFRRQDFQSHRSGVSGFYYQVPVPANDQYILRLGFAEVYEGNCAPGKRVMNVRVNGKEFVSGLDVYSSVGCNSALVLEQKVQAYYGTLAIEFTSTVENPMISLIEVESLKTIEEICPCFDQEKLENGDYEAWFEGRGGNVDFFADRANGQSFSTTCDEASEDQAEVCEKIYDDAIEATFEQMMPYPGETMAESCPCWPDISVFQPAKNQVWFRIFDSSFARVNVGNSDDLDVGLGYRAEALSCTINSFGRRGKEILVDQEVTKAEFNRCFVDIKNAVVA